MGTVLFISNLIVPMTIVGIVLYGITGKVNVYNAFLDGAKDGIVTVYKIVPTLIGLMVAIAMLRASGTLDIITRIFIPLTRFAGFPEAAMPLTLMRLVSSSAATGLLLDVFKEYGPDSFIGRFVSIMMSSTETIFYTMSVYFLSVKITKTRYTLAGALIANAAGIVFSLFLTGLLFG